MGTAFSAEIKLGIIDTQRIMTQSKAAQEAMALFNKEYQEKTSQLSAKQQAAQMLQDEINQKGKDMSQEVLADKTEQLSRQIKEFNRLKNDAEEDLESGYEELNQKLLREIAEVVEEFSKNESYTMILEKNSVVSNDDAIDITDQIIDLYDAIK
jgi:outer membrane protein